MRRPLLLASWVVCVFALSTAELGSERAGVRSAMAQSELNRCSADPSASCVSYRQKMKRQGINLILKSRCKGNMECTVSWKLKCTGDPKSRPNSSVFTLMPRSTEIVDASADACGDSGWEIRGVSWNCNSDD